VVATAHDALTVCAALLVHGTGDDKVLYSRGTHARDTLTPVCASVTFHQFDGGHEFAGPSVGWLQAFLEGGTSK